MATLICWWGQRCIYAFFKQICLFCPEKYSYSRRPPECFLSEEALELRGALPPRPPRPHQGPLSGPLDPGPPAVNGESCARSASHGEIFLKSVITPLLKDEGCVYIDMVIRKNKKVFRWANTWLGGYHFLRNRGAMKKLGGHRIFSWKIGGSQK